MAVFGMELDRKNPDFLKSDFLFWMPHFKVVLTDEDFIKIRDIVTQKIYKSIWGSDWEYAMSLGVAHFLELRAKNLRLPEAKDWKSVSGGSNFLGTVSSMSVGAFSKSIETGNTTVASADAFFWNQTSYGANLMALMKTRPVPSIFVITNERKK